MLYSFKIAILKKIKHKYFTFIVTHSSWKFLH